MTPEFSILTVIGLAFTLILYVFKYLYENNAKKIKEIEDEDKKIDSAHSFDDFVRIDDELRNK